MMRYLIALLLITINTYAKDLGTFGNVYHIAEKDVIAEIEKRSAETDWTSALYAEADKLKKQAGTAAMVLPPAENEYSYFVDMTYTLNHTISKYDTQGNPVGVLYPKGFTFNPLDYMSVTETYVILNGTRDAEIRWFNKHFKDDYRAFPIITEGNAFDVSDKLSRPVYTLEPEFRDRFSIKHTLSVIYEDFSRKMMRVDVLRIQNEKTIDNTTVTDSN